MTADSLELDESLLAAIAERRLALRVPVSLEVAVRDGSRRRRGEVVDLSLTGCRMRFDEPVTADRRPWIWLPAGLGGRLAQPIGSEVAWTDSLHGAPTGHCQVGLTFRRFPFQGRKRLQRLLEELLAKTAQTAPFAEPESAADERRAAPRAPYERRVIARGAGAPLVMLGRDLSATGICVQTRRALAIGDRLQIALHAGGSAPLVLSAEVVRGIGDDHWALTFRELVDAQRERIETLLREQVAPNGASPGALLVSQQPDPETERAATT
jgi:hypothetical protein